MFREPSEQSLVQILQERPDTCFDGWQIDDESKVDRYKDREYMKVYRDGHGNHYQTDNDYIQTREKDGQRVGADSSVYGDGRPRPVCGRLRRPGETVLRTA